MSNEVIIFVEHIAEFDKWLIHGLAIIVEIFVKVGGGKTP